MIFVAVNLILQKKHKSGVHQWDIRLRDLSHYLYVCTKLTLCFPDETDKIKSQYARINCILFSFIMFFIKLAILLQYLRAFVPLKQRNWMFWACHILIWLNFLFYSIFFFFVIFACSPTEKLWKPWIEGNCFDHLAFMINASVIYTISDILIVILPQPIIWKLQISARRKIGLSAIFAVGILWVWRYLFEMFQQYNSCLFCF